MAGKFNMDMASNSVPMAKYMTVIGSTDKNMDMVRKLTQLNIIPSKDNGKMDYKTDKEKKNGKMDQSTMAAGSMEHKVVMASFVNLMD